MRAWVLPQQGSIGNLRLEYVECPEPRAGQVVLQLRYAALNPADRYLAEGLYPARPSFPHILGRDGVGSILSVGQGVADWRQGDTALLLRGDAGVERPGTLAEQVVVPAECIVRPPQGWSDPQSACAALVYVTAYQALTQWGELAPSTVLISGATGGVGLASVQLASAMGHTVIGLSRSLEKATKLSDFGAAKVFNPADPGWTSELKRFLHPRRVDLAVDNVGGALLPQLVDTLALNGRVSLVGALAGPVRQFNTASLLFRRIRMGGVAISTYSRDENHQAWQAILTLLERIGQSPVVDSIYPMSEVPAAFARLADGPLGKVVIDITG